MIPFADEGELEFGEVPEELARFVAEEWIDGRGVPLSLGEARRAFMDEWSRWAEDNDFDVLDAKMLRGAARRHAFYPQWSMPHPGATAIPTRLPRSQWKATGALMHPWDYV